MDFFIVVDGNSSAPDIAWNRDTLTAILNRFRTCHISLFSVRSVPIFQSNFKFQLARAGPGRLGGPARLGGGPALANSNSNLKKKRKALAETVRKRSDNGPKRSEMIRKRPETVRNGPKTVRKRLETVQKKNKVLFFRK